MRELSDQLEWEALELVLLDQLVQVDGQKLKGDAGVGPETNLTSLIYLNGPWINEAARNKKAPLLIRPTDYTHFQREAIILSSPALNTTNFKKERTPGPTAMGQRQQESSRN